mmetsp:Transcript_19574/g.63736  ORF Transcript_19574/g.63736 Transcript_19574/m.63736 type:complete len:231 (-) Transcript_19574:1652-2344(-)
MGNPHVAPADDALRRCHTAGSDARRREWGRRHAAAGRAELIADLLEHSQQIVLHIWDEDFVVKRDDILRRVVGGRHAHLAEDLGRRLLLPLVLLNDVAERLGLLLWPLVHLAHAVDGAHDDLVQVPADEQVSVRGLDDGLDALPDLDDERGAQEQPEAHIVHPCRGHILDLFQEGGERRLGARRPGARAGGRGLLVVFACECVQWRVLGPGERLEHLDLEVTEVSAQVLW